MQEYRNSGTKGFTDSQMNTLNRNLMRYLRGHPAASRDDIIAKGYMSIVTKLYESSIRRAKEAAGTPKKYFTGDIRKGRSRQDSRKRPRNREFVKRGRFSGSR